MATQTEVAREIKTSEKAWDFVKPLVLKSIIGSVIGAALVAIFAVIVGEFGTMQVQLMMTIVLIVVFSLLSLYDADVSAKRSHVFALISVCVSAYLLIAGLGKIWLIHEPTYEGYNPEYYNATSNVIDSFSSWLGLAFVARIALLHAHLLLNIHRHYQTPTLQLVAKATMGLIAFLAILLSLPLLTPELEYHEAYWRLLGAIAILDVLGTVLIPLSYALFHRRNMTDAEREQERLRLASYGRPLNNTGAASHKGLPPLGQSHPNNATPPKWGAQEPSAPPVVAEHKYARPQQPPIPTSELVHQKGTIKFDNMPVPSRALAWPRYADGTPLPSLQDGTPDFSAVERY